MSQFYGPLTECERRLDQQTKADSDESIHFLAFLPNADPSVTRVKLRHGFRFESRPKEEIFELLSQLEGLPYTDIGKRMFLDTGPLRASGDKVVVVSNVFNAWGNEEGYFADYDPEGGPERDDAFLVEEYLRPTISVMNLFKEGNLFLSTMYYYSLQNGTPWLSSKNYGPVGGFFESKYNIEGTEVPELQKFVLETVIPFRQGFLKLAFDLYERSYGIGNFTISFLTLMIAMEALFNDGRRPYSKNIAKNAGKLLAENDPEREKTIRQEIQQLYEKRSVFVHTGLSYYSPPSLWRPPKNQVEGGYVQTRTMDKLPPELILKEDKILLRHYVRESVKKAYKIGLDKSSLIKRLRDY